MMPVSRTDPEVEPDLINNTKTMKKIKRKAQQLGYYNRNKEGDEGILHL